jgi:hypothetical protein
MNNPTIIRDIANLRLEDAIMLFNNDLYDGAFIWQVTL